MPRFFLEVSYKGTNYSGFQAQENANTIQAEIEKAMKVLVKETVSLTGSSRTDAGVHAVQNFFHFDIERPTGSLVKDNSHKQFIYNLNAILPTDIAIKNLFVVADEAHCRFDAVSREYNYYIARSKDPFLRGRSLFFPYKLDRDKMEQAAEILMGYEDFTSFSKRNTQVRSFICRIEKSEWIWKDTYGIYHVKGNRFLRGMVRALTATMLKVGRNKISIDQFREVIEAKDCTKASFAVPAEGLFLMSVNYPAHLLDIK
jgi:tRNA pseudouridine38-40 synthase